MAGVLPDLIPSLVGEAVAAPLARSPNGRCRSPDGAPRRRVVQRAPARRSRSTIAGSLPRCAQSSALAPFSLRWLTSAPRAISSSTVDARALAHRHHQRRRAVRRRRIDVGALGEQVADDRRRGRRSRRRSARVQPVLIRPRRRARAASCTMSRRPPSAATISAVSPNALRALTFARVGEQHVDRRRVAGARGDHEHRVAVAVDGVRIRRPRASRRLDFLHPIVGHGDRRSPSCDRCARAAGATMQQRGGEQRRQRDARPRRRSVRHGVPPWRRSRTAGRNWPSSPARCLRAARRAGARSRPRRAARRPAGCACRGTAPARDTGESVSISSRSSGTRRATSFSSCAFLNVTMPENEMWKPRSSAARATSQVSVKQCITPPASRAPSSRMIASVSAAAARVWMTSGLPAARAARMWTRKRSRCQSRSPSSR